MFNETQKKIFDAIDKEMKAQQDELYKEIEDISDVVVEIVDNVDNLGTEFEKLSKQVLLKSDIAKIKPKDGKSGKPGRDGLDGLDGKDGKSIPGPAGKDGKDGSPDNGDQIIGKINDSNLYINVERVKGLSDFYKKGVAKDGYPYGWPQPAGAITYKLNGAQVGRGNILNITGSGVTFTPNDDGGTYHISGGGGGDMEIGNPVIGGDPDSILYIDNSGNLTQDSLFTRDHNTLITNELWQFTTSAAVDVTSGFKMYDNVANFGLKGSMFYQSDGTNQIEAGVFDTTDVGGGPLTWGVVSIAGTGEQTTMLLNGGTTPSMTQQFQAANGDQTQTTYFPTGFHIETRASGGGNPFGFEASTTGTSWFGANHSYLLPSSLPTTNQVMSVTGVSGSSVTLGWANNGGGGGGSSSDPEFSIQTSDGSGGFASNANFLFNYSTNIPYWTLDDGIILNSLTDYRFGKFLAGHKKGFFDISGSNPVMTYDTTVIEPSSIFFAYDVVGGVNNLSYNSYSSYDDGTQNWVLTIDGSGSGYSGMTFTGGGDIDNLTISDPFYADIPATVPVTYTVISKGVIYNAGGINATITGVPVNGEQVVGGTSGAIGYFVQYDPADDGYIYLYGVVGTFVNGETVTGATSGFTWVVSGTITPDTEDWAFLWNDSSVGNYYAAKAIWDGSNTIGNLGYELTIELHGFAAANPDGSTWVFGWDFPDGYMDWVINPAVGVLDEGETIATYTDDWTQSFTGTGLNNLSIYTANYDGGPFAYTWTMTIDGVGVTDIWNIGIATGSFQNGDSFTFTSGGTATLVNAISVGGGSAYFTGATGSINPGDTATGPNGSFTLNTYAGAGDTITWTDGTTTQNNVPINGSGAMVVGHSLYLNYGTAGGHTLGDFNTVNHNVTLEGTGTARRTDLMSIYNHIYITEWSDPSAFQPGNYFLGLTSNVWSTLDSFDQYGDTFINNRNSVDVQTHQPILGGFSVSSIGADPNEFTVVWGNVRDHVIGDNWTFGLTQIERSRIRVEGNDVYTGDIFGGANLFHQDLSAGITYLSASVQFNITNPSGNIVGAFDTVNRLVTLGDTVSGGMYMSVGGTNKVFQVIGSTNSTYMHLDDAQQQFDVFMGDTRKLFLDKVNNFYGIGGLDNISDERLELDVDAGTVFLGASNTNDGNLQFNNSDHTSDWLTLSGQVNPIGIRLNGDDEVITYQGAKVETQIRTVAYNTSNGMNLGDYVIYVSGSTGPTSFNLDTVVFPIGHLLIIKDFDCIASTSNITIDAGTGNTIRGTSINQTYDMTEDGECVYIRKVTATDWQIE